MLSDDFALAADANMLEEGKRGRKGSAFRTAGLQDRVQKDSVGSGQGKGMKDSTTRYLLLHTNQYYQPQQLATNPNTRRSLDPAPPLAHTPCLLSSPLCTFPRHTLI